MNRSRLTVVQTRQFSDYPYFWVRQNEPSCWQIAAVAATIEPLPADRRSPTGIGDSPMILGPVFWMEMRTGARRARHYGTRVFFVSVVFALVVIAWYSFLSYRAMMRGMYGYSGVLVSVFTPLAPHELPQLGRKIFSAYSMTQFLLVLLLAPLYSAGAVAADRERRVLEMIFTTDLSNIELVASKFLVQTIHLLALAVAGLPVMFLCLLLGGVAAEDLLATFTLTLATVVFVSSLGLLISIGTRRAYGAIIVTYLILLVAWLAMPIIAAFHMFGGGAPIAAWYSDVCTAIFSLNPIIALMSVAIDGPPPAMWANAPWVCSAAYGAMALVLMIINILVIRKLGLWASRERVVRDRKKGPGAPGRTRQVWSNPVAWREVKTNAVHRRMRWARILCLLFSFMITAIVWVGWLSDWLQGRTALAIDIEGTSVVIACTATVAWVLMALQGAVSSSHEREQNTLDTLLTTPLAGYHIVLGKLQGIVRSSAFALAFPIGFALVAWSRNVTTLRAAVLSVAVIMLVGIFAACLGLVCSVRLGASGKACGLAAGIMLVLCLGVPLASETFISYIHRFGWQKVTFISPSMNLSWAIYDEDARTVDSDRFQNWQGYRRWPERLWASTAHLFFEQCLALLFTVWSVVHIEGRCRVRQWGVAQGFWGGQSTIRLWPTKAVLAARTPTDVAETK